MLLCPDWLFGQRANAEIRVLGGFAKTCQDFAFFQVDLTLHVNASDVLATDVNALTYKIIHFHPLIHLPLPQPHFHMDDSGVLHLAGMEVVFKKSVEVEDPASSSTGKEEEEEESTFPAIFFFFFYI